LFEEFGDCPGEPDAVPTNLPTQRPADTNLVCSRPKRENSPKALFREVYFTSKNNPFPAFRR
jgi:hypothetical protein